MYFYILTQHTVSVYMTLVCLHTVFITTNSHFIPYKVSDLITFLVARFDNGKRNPSEPRVDFCTNEEYGKQVS